MRVTPKPDTEDSFAGSSDRAASTGRPWIGVTFVCAAQYVRVFRNPEGTSYHATCPKCGRGTRFRVGSGGTDCRFFEVRCR